MTVTSPNSIRLYRYLDAAAALKTIEDRRFRISRLRDLNDPFEWRFGYKLQNLELEATIDAWRESVFESRNKVLGIICFSATSKEPVLWSHYADKHRGVAFEVDCINDPKLLKEISYPQERQVMDIETYAELQRHHDETSLKKYLLPIMEQTIRQKSPSWAYEKEYRFNVEFENVANLQIHNGHYFLRIPDDFLTRVILGWKCPLEEKYVLKALEAVDLNSTKVVRAKISSDSYEVLC
jgi:hypothetical protein